MYCRNCGSEIAEGSRFCNHCGSPVEAPAAPVVPESSGNTETAPPQEVEEPIVRKPIFEEFQWDVSEYPDRNNVAKTEEINFNWNAAPESIAEAPVMTEAPEVMTGADLEKEVFDTVEPRKAPEEMSAAERIDKFYTFNSKNEEFQKLINSEYRKVKTGSAIEHELSEADKLASERFDTRAENTSMEAFLEKEGIVKTYQPKAFESDVLRRIEAQEAARETQRLEEEARLAAIEEARLAAEAQKRLEEEAKRKAAEEAAQLEEVARRKAEEEARAAEEARLRAAEEERLRAEEEARIQAEAEARRKAEAEARFKAAEEARLKAEADLRAAQEAAKIRAQQEARLAAEAEAQLKADQERQRMEAEEAQRKLEEKRKVIAQEADQVIAQEEARKVLEQTARLREQEEAKIRAAVAGLRSGAALRPETERNIEAEEAHQAARNQINEMEKARNAFFADMDETPASNENAGDIPVAAPVTGRETMLSSDELTKTRVINKADIAAGLNEATRVAKAKPEPAAADDEDFFNSLEMAGTAAQTALQDVQPHEAQPIDFKEPVQPANDLEELLSRFEETVPAVEPEPAAADLTEPEEKPGLDDTLLMPQEETFEEALNVLPANDFDSYGNDAAVQNIAEKAPADDFYNEGFYGDDEELSKKELKQKAKEQKRLEKERAREKKAAGKKAKSDYIDEVGHESEDESGNGGKGRIVLKVVLVVLIVILAVEVVGMGIRFLAPQSRAAEFIDNQLNKVIQLITGEDTEYSVIAAQVRTEPMEDKTELINAQIGKNKNGNIDSIVYSEDLGHDQSTDGDISDLVLSTPMTVVEWGRDDKNYPVYYDEQVVGQIIAFESNKVELMNNGDEKVLGMIDPDMSLYSETAALKGQAMDSEFKKLEIGEIRQAGSNYYVWVRETIGDTTVRKVYSMYPEKEFVMKMAACYVV